MSVFMKESLLYIYEDNDIFDFQWFTTDRLVTNRFNVKLAADWLHLIAVSRAVFEATISKKRSQVLGAWLELFWSSRNFQALFSLLWL